MAEGKKDFDRGNRISKKRKELGLSQDELADRIGICRQALSAIENGGTFKVHTLDKLVSALGTTEKYIMHGDIEESKTELMSEALNVLSEMDELQIRRCIEVLKTLKNF